MVANWFTRLGKVMVIAISPIAVNGHHWHRLRPGGTKSRVSKSVFTYPPPLWACVCGLSIARSRYRIRRPKRRIPFPNAHAVSRCALGRMADLCRRCPQESRKNRRKIPFCHTRRWWGTSEEYFRRGI